VCLDHADNFVLALKPGEKLALGECYSCGTDSLVLLYHKYDCVGFCHPPYINPDPRVSYGFLNFFAL